MAKQYQVGTSAFKTAFADVIAGVGTPNGTSAWLERAKTRAAELHTERGFDPEGAFDLQMLIDKLTEIHTNAMMQMEGVAADAEIDRAVEEEIAKEVQREASMPRSSPAPEPKPEPTRKTPRPSPQNKDRVSVPIRTIGQAPKQPTRIWPFVIGLGIGMLVGGLLVPRIWK